MQNEMFCFQCEQTAGCTACTGKTGVCGKQADTANLQDKLTGALIGLARAAEGNEPSNDTDKGLPRLMDMGQCNDAYSAIRVAAALADAFDCGLNDLPLTLILSWYEQKAVCILLSLLHLGIKNIYLGPTLPSFLSPNVLDILVNKYKIHPISTPENDLENILITAKQ